MMLSSAVPQMMLSSALVPQMMLSPPPVVVPQMMLSPKSVPQMMLSSAIVPQTMLSSDIVPQITLVPQTMLVPQRMLVPLTRWPMTRVPQTILVPQMMSVPQMMLSSAMKLLRQTIRTRKRYRAELEDRLHEVWRQHVLPAEAVLVVRLQHERDDAARDAGRHARSAQTEQRLAILRVPLVAGERGPQRGDQAR